MNYQSTKFSVLISVYRKKRNRERMNVIVKPIISLLNSESKNEGKF